MSNVTRRGQYRLADPNPARGAGEASLHSPLRSTLDFGSAFDDTAEQAGQKIRNRPDRLIDHINRKLSGDTAPVVGDEADDLATAGSVLAQLFDTVLHNNQRISEFQSEQIGQQSAGQVININFEDYPDGPLPSIFTVTYDPGPGLSELVVAGGQAGWALVDDGEDRSANVIYNDPTDTDFQIVRGTMVSPPQQAGRNGDPPQILALARVNDPLAPDTFVFARGRAASFLNYRADIGYWVDGIETIWLPDIPLSWSLDMYLKAGVGSNPRMYQLFSGTKLVEEFTEPGTASALGSGFRHWGARSEMKGSDQGPRHPGKIAASSVVDNELPAVVGSYARMYRTSTAGVTVSTGVHLLPNDFVSVIAERTPDIACDPTLGMFTPSMSGNYRLDLVSETNPSGQWPNGLRFRAFVNGVSSLMMGRDHLRGTGTLGGNLVPRSVNGDVVLPLLAGDEVQVGYDATDNANNALTGEASGDHTYIALTLVNKSMA